ncbi:hypothetical protein G7Y89_g14672 [Cudoniella acicularis]|uniref:Uncharacterized protein n=1 Tax=Cudoniella acicularis TaxID=354080 RepID=A0A8H4R0S5_9HELO|nr:hypothetical protein G7Y89_g14672 [Cudoniella acicularis]
MFTSVPANLQQRSGGKTESDIEKSATSSHDFRGTGSRGDNENSIACTEASTSVSEMELARRPEEAFRVVAHNLEMSEALTTPHFFSSIFFKYLLLLLSASPHFQNTQGIRIIATEINPSKDVALSDTLVHIPYIVENAHANDSAEDGEEEENGDGDLVDYSAAVDFASCGSEEGADSETVRVEGARYAGFGNFVREFWWSAWRTYATNAESSAKHPRAIFFFGFQFLGLSASSLSKSTGVCESSDVIAPKSGDFEPDNLSRVKSSIEVEKLVVILAII